MAEAQQNPQTVQAPAEDENHIIAERRAKLARALPPASLIRTTSSVRISSATLRPNTAQ